MTDHKNSQLPTRDQILEFILNSRGTVGRREIARTFGLRGADRNWLRQELKNLKKEGLIGGNRRRATRPVAIPPVTVIEVSHIDSQGDAICIPSKQGKQLPPAIIYLSTRPNNPINPGVGDRFLARLKKMQDDSYEAIPIRILPAIPKRFIGLMHANMDGATIRSIERNDRQDLFIKKENMLDATDGDYVLAQSIPNTHSEARVIERLGAEGEPQIVSVLVLKSKNIPIDFDAETMALAKSKTVPEIGTRRDFRKTQFVTIDGNDARDFDDAVWAAPDTAKNNQNGWKLRIAVADVAYYVREGDALDQTARLRGNSVYCPDRVVPMLPESLSNGLCSLKPNEDRACIVACITIDATGTVIKKNFVRGLMRSVARLTYEQVQSAYDGIPEDETGSLTKKIIKPLYGAFDVLNRARQKRGTLELELPERKIEFNKTGHVHAINEQQRLDSHRMIEEFMITANVAAAEVLEQHSEPVMYRIHDRPAADKIESLAEAVNNLGLKFKKTNMIDPRSFSLLVKNAHKKNISKIVNEIVLRTQSQAVYGPLRIGHFGLGLKTYCHFTSPIRRYSDLLVHRSLITALKLGSDGHSSGFAQNYSAIGEEISKTERRAMAVEREVKSRLITGFIAERIGAEFKAQITGITRFGIFVRLNDNGAEGLIPIGTLPGDWYNVAKSGLKMTEERTGIHFYLGETVNVKLVEALPITGSLKFAIVAKNATAYSSGRRKSRHKRHPKRRH